ncbi:MAG: cyclic nucleotide-binding domain-containing protein [Alphaproteobacteria bacterium]|nr:cyclic nucleotide-binding domain-containing protein [Alphaproteobacteria bacterium]
MDTYAALSKLSIARMVSERHRRQASEIALTPYRVGAGETLLVEGEDDDTMMLVCEGELEVLVGDPPMRVATITEGRLLGEMALFSKHGRRSATVRTLTPCKLLLLDRGNLEVLRQLGNALVPMLESTALRSLGRRLREVDALIASLAEGQPLQAPDPGMLSRLMDLFKTKAPEPPPPAPPDPVAILRAAPSFAGLDARGVTALAQLLTPMPVTAGQEITREGIVDEGAFVVASGQVDVFRETAPERHARIAVLGPGSLFGTVSLVHGRVRSATCIAEKPGWLLKVPRGLYDQLSEASTLPAQVLRRAVYDSLSEQLTMANRTLSQLRSTALNARRPG